MSVPVAVLDLNVLISGLFPRHAVAHQLLQRFRDGAFRALFENLREDALIIEPMERPQVVLADPDDDALFACALAAGATYVVSRDHAVLAIPRFGAIQVVSPADFLAILSSRSPAA